MPHVTIAIIRHSISCSNFYHNKSHRNDDCDPITAAIIKIPDPELSHNGKIMCREYAASLQQRLIAEGIDLDTALIGGSYLRRAQQTASLLFPRRPIHRVPHITEPGDMPVNTPAGGLKHPSSWPDALVHLAHTGHNQFVLVSHGNFMRYTIWPAVSAMAHRPSTWMANLDTLIIRGVLTPGGHLLQPTVHKIAYDGRLNHESAGDRCRLPRHLTYIHRLVKVPKAQQLRDMERAATTPSEALLKKGGSRQSRESRRTRRRPRPELKREGNPQK